MAENKPTVGAEPTPVQHADAPLPQEAQAMLAPLGIDWTNPDWVRILGVINALIDLFKYWPRQAQASIGPDLGNLHAVIQLCLEAASRTAEHVQAQSGAVAGR